MKEVAPISLDKVNRYSLRDRESKIKIEHFGHSWKKGGSMIQWLESLPGILAGNDLREIAGRIVRAAVLHKTIVLGMGGHVIKVGLNPIIIDLMERGIITGIAMNGSCIIHDTEIAMVGHTSEDVAAEIGEGNFGMAEETGKYLNSAISEGAKTGLGLGKSVGAMLTKENFPYKDHSLLARAYELGIPVTVHVAIGTDIIHFHPGVDGAAIGNTSHLDFRIFSRIVSSLEGGIFMNIGSAVIIPEVFLKALTLVRNIGYKVKGFTTVNMDFIKHYRPMTNVVHRPTLEGGKGYSLVGHHEIMFPLLTALVIEGLHDKKLLNELNEE